MCSGSWPNFNQYLMTAWGAGAEFWVNGCRGVVVGLSFGTNPPYYLDDFLSVNPKFFGLPTAFSNAALTNGSPNIALANTFGLLIGQLVQCVGLPPGTLITGVTAAGITVSNNATQDVASGVLSAWLNPVVPVSVIQFYINLASASLVQDRWQEQWLVAMSWFIAHYCTLYAQTDAAELITITQNATHGEAPTGTLPGTSFTLSAVPPGGLLQGLYKNGSYMTVGVDYTLVGLTITTNDVVQATDLLYATWPVPVTSTTQVAPTAASVAAQGVANGIEVSKSVGDVSASYQALASLEDWGSWNLTKYGQQLATMARVIGSGPMLVW